MSRRFDGRTLEMACRRPSSAWVADRAHGEVRTGRAVTGLVRRPDGWWVHTDGGPAERVDEVVVACPPHHAAPLLAQAPEGAAIAQELSAFVSFRTRMLLHTDPAYVHADPALWSAYNALVTGGWCEGSVWYGAMRDRHRDGGAVDVFKSWATGRAWEPREVVAEAEYRHPLITPAYVAAQARIEARQGRDGLWFAGSWTRDVDLQETALGSALRVVGGMGVRPRWSPT
jgi:predicted NAD/FAD-binding protein